MPEQEKVCETEFQSVNVTNEFVTKERVWALIRAVCMVVSSVAALMGYAFDADMLFNAISIVAMVVSLGWGYWKNNNWTELANMAQSLLVALKGMKKDCQ